MDILFATDRSDSAGAAARFLAALPLPAGTALHIITVADPVAWRLADWAHAVQWEWGEKTLAEAAAVLTREGITLTTAFRQGPVAREILRAADEFDADLITVGSRGLTGVPGFLLGSVARNVAHHAARPVLVARALRNALRRVLLPVDDSENACAAVDLAASLPLPTETEILVTHVLSPLAAAHGRAALDPEARERLERRHHHDSVEEARRFVDGAVTALHRTGCRASPVFREGDPAAEILALAEEERADLIVVGARGKSVIERLVVGSVADRLLRHAPASVLIVR
jgi:nucleotide-binding universal stress UspA family protein